MPTTRVRLTAIGPGKWLLLALGMSVSGLFTWFCLQGIVASADPWWMRLLAVVFALLFVAPWIVLPVSVRTRLRWMELDDRFDHDAQYELRGKSGLYRRIMYRVPPWLELVPAGAEVVRAHAELGQPVPPGDGQPARWMVQLNRGWARRPLVGEHVLRLRPDLWRGERHGSTPRAAGPQLPWTPAPPRPPAPPTPAPPPSAPAAPGPAQVVELPRGARVRRTLAVLVVALGITVLMYTVRDVPSWIATTVMVPTSLALVVALGSLLLARQPDRLVADDESLRLVRGSRAPAWRIPWSDVAAIRLERHGDRATLLVRPTGPDAVDAHPLLDPYWRSGRRTEWRLPLGHIGTQRLAVRELVLRRRADLWVDDTVRPA